MNRKLLNGFQVVKTKDDWINGLNIAIITGIQELNKHKCGKKLNEISISETAIKIGKLFLNQPKIMTHNRLTIAGVSIYLSCLIHGKNLSQEIIADSIDIRTETLRKGFKEIYWLLNGKK